MSLPHSSYGRPHTLKLLLKWESVLVQALQSESPSHWRLSRTPSTSAITITYNLNSAINAFACNPEWKDAVKLDYNAFLDFFSKWKFVVEGGPIETVVMVPRTEALQVVTQVKHLAAQQIVKQTNQDRRLRDLRLDPADLHEFGAVALSAFIGVINFPVPFLGLTDARHDSLLTTYAGLELAQQTDEDGTVWTYLL